MDVKERVALKLMEAIDLAYREDPNLLNFIILEVERAVNNLGLPELRCEVCGRRMSWFDYHLCKGICSECSEKLGEDDS